MHSLTTLSSYSDGTVAEVTKQLSAAQHESIERERADTARPKVVQRRVSFLWERQAFELHTDMEPAYGINVLHRRSEVSVGVFALELAKPVGDTHHFSSSAFCFPGISGPICQVQHLLQVGA